MNCGDSYAIGTNRLPIIDLENAIQPAENEDGTIICVLNGEIYNYKKLKGELEQKGHTFKNNSDTEVLIHLYEKHKEKMFDFLDSEIYAFVIYDKKTNEYFAARDIVGVKPLYWAKSNGTTYFASEMKQLIGFSDVTEINAVPPGHYIKNGRIEKYSDLIKEKEITKENLSSIAKNVRELFYEAVKKRVQTDLPIGVFLSGGLDSTAVLEVARKYNKKITALIVGRKGSVDAYHAKKYCQEFDIQYKIMEPPSISKLEGDIEDIVYITETFEPNVIRQSVISYYISKLGEEHRIILCGEGADEIFDGYPEFLHGNSDKIKKLEIEFLSDLNRTQCQRVDRTSMQFTEEVRAPFLDKKLIDYALRIPGKYKVKNGIEKWILRKALEKDLPEYICWRKKVVLSEGAGYKGNDPQSGIFDEFIESRMSDEEFEKTKNKFGEWNIKTKEEAYYFRIFKKFGFDKGKFAQKRPRVNRIRSVDQKLLRILKSRKFNRHRSYKIEEIKENEVKFVMFWGTLGKVVVDELDMQSIEFLDGFKKKIELAVGKEIELKIILADSHAKMNKIEQINSYTYLQNIKDILENRNFKTVYLSSLWKNWNLNLHKIENNILKTENQKLTKILEKASSRYSQGTLKEGYKMYYTMRKIEKKHLEKEFKDYIFLTYNNPVFREILPDLPTLYIYSRKGFSEPPWLNK